MGANTAINKSGQQELLPLSAIRTDGDTQPRAAGLDPNAVAEYADSMSAGVEFPPPIVFFDGTDYWLADGFHRLAARRMAGFETILAEVHSGTQEDARWHACSANREHLGVRRSNEDKKRAVTTALRHPRSVGMSDRSIASHVGVDAKTVGRRREELVATKEIPQCQTRIGADGRTINVARIGKRPQPQATEGAVSEVASAEELGGQPASAVESGVQIAQDPAIASAPAEETLVQFGRPGRHTEGLRAEPASEPDSSPEPRHADEEGDEATPPYSSPTDSRSLEMALAPQMPGTDFAFQYASPEEDAHPGSSQKDGGNSVLAGGCARLDELKLDSPSEELAPPLAFGRASAEPSAPGPAVFGTDALCECAAPESGEASSEPRPPQRKPATRIEAPDHSRRLAEACIQKFNELMDYTKNLEKAAKYEDSIRHRNAFLEAVRPVIESIWAEKKGLLKIA